MPAYWASGAVEALSAGPEAHGQNPRAVTVMAEDGVDISDQASTRFDASVLARAGGSEDMIMTEFRRVREAISQRVDALIHEHQPAGR